MAETYTQARIRVRARGALVTREALLNLEDDLLRRHKLASGNSNLRSAINADIREIRRVLDELDRTIEEQGWETDEPLRSLEA